MRPGDQVIVVEDPLNYGIGVILWVEPDGRIMVEFDPDPAAEWVPPHREALRPLELELASVWMRAA